MNYVIHKNYLLIPSTQIFNLSLAGIAHIFLLPSRSDSELQENRYLCWLSTLYMSDSYISSYKFARDLRFLFQSGMNFYTFLGTTIISSFPSAWLSVLTKFELKKIEIRGIPLALNSFRSSKLVPHKSIANIDCCDIKKDGVKFPLESVLSFHNPHA